MKQKFNITGMTCSACSARVEKVSNALPGMKSASVNLLSNSMMAEYDETQLTPERIIAAVVEAGYGASLPRSGPPKQAAVSGENVVEQELAEMKRRITVLQRQPDGSLAEEEMEESL